MPAEHGRNPRKRKRGRKHKGTGHVAAVEATVQSSDDATLDHSARRRRRIETRSQVRPPTSLLDLPDELLIEIFVLSSNAALAEVCRRFAAVFGLDLQAGGVIAPTWMQRRFVTGLHAHLPYAIDIGLRRPFFSDILLATFEPEMTARGWWKELHIPLRLVVEPPGFDPSLSGKTVVSSSSTCDFGGPDEAYVRTLERTTRRMLLYSALFLHGVALPAKTRNIALTRYAEQTHARPALLFWQASRNFTFDPAYLSKAVRTAARIRAYGSGGTTLPFLLGRFGCPADAGEPLLALAIKRKDRALLDLLQQHGVRPSMDALSAVLRA